MQWLFSKNATLVDMGKYTELSSSSKEYEDESEEDFEGALLVIDGVVSPKNMLYKDRDLLIKHINYWKKRRSDIVDLRERASKVSKKVMKHGEKIALVKKVSEIDNYYHMREILQIIAFQTCNPTVVNEVDYVFSAEVLDNPTLRQIESFVDDPEIFIDQRMFTRIGMFIEILQEILLGFDKATSETDSGRINGKFSGIGKVLSSSSSKFIRNGISANEVENEQKEYQLPLLLPLKPRNCQAMNARRNEKPGSILMWLPLKKSVWTSLESRRTSRAHAVQKIRLLLPLNTRSCKATQARRKEKSGSIMMRLPIHKSAWNVFKKDVRVKLIQ